MPGLDKRKLIYKGVAGAIKLVVLIGTKKALAIAIRNNRLQLRYTPLVHLFQIWRTSRMRSRVDAQLRRGAGAATDRIDTIEPPTGSTTGSDAAEGSLTVELPISVSVQPDLSV